MPRARREGLVIEEVADELLVYDLERHRAHRLNPAAALVWRACDGRQRVRDVAALVARLLGTPLSAPVVGLAVERLQRSGLMEPQAAPVRRIPSLSRRELIGVLGIAAAALPAVTSIVAPTPAHAATCVPSGGVCATTADCCPGLNCIGVAVKVCL
jgi:hypothetical protein